MLFESILRKEKRKNDSPVISSVTFELGGSVDDLCTGGYVVYTDGKICTRGA